MARVIEHMEDEEDPSGVCSGCGEQWPCTSYAMSQVTDIINTSNDYLLMFGQNLPNHSTSIAGRGKFVRQSIVETPTFRTAQQAYRYAAWLATMAEMLPDEAGAEEHTFDAVRAAIRNT